MIPGFLRDTALLHYREFDPAVQGDWDRLHQALATHFVPLQDTQLHANALAARKQESGEEVTHYATALQKLVRSAYPTMPADHHQGVLRDFFIKGLRRDIQAHILTTMPGASFQEALGVAQSFDTGLKLLQGVRDLTSKEAYGEKPKVYAGFALNSNKGPRRGRQATTYSTYRDSSFRPGSPPNWLRWGLGP